MNAIVSGRAGVAMVLDGDQVASLHVGSGVTTTVCRLEDFPFLFGDANDLQFLESVELHEVADRLAHDFDKEQALQLSLVLLDKRFSPHPRRLAGEELEALFRGEEVKRFVEGVLYAHPLPEEADLAGALEYIQPDAHLVRDLLAGLGENQDHIVIAEYAGPVTTVVYPDGVHILNNLWYQARPLVADWLAETL